MFQSLADKVISGVISLSMLLFSSYEGNNARFSDLETVFLNHNLIFRTQLVEAFDNDFEDIIKSGSEIDIFFSVELSEDGAQFHKVEFKHTVNYVPMEQIYYVSFDERNELLLYESYDQVISDISKIEYIYKDRIPDKFKVVISAHLEKMTLAGNPKEYDLMMLWNFKKPKIKKTITKPENET
jgi:hypothetical protein